MKKNYHTVELARLYENQGYYALALEHYSSVLAGDEKNEKLSEAVKRVTLKIEQGEKGAAEKKVSILFEQWLELLMLEKKLKMYRNIQKISSRLSVKAKDLISCHQSD